MDTVEISFRLQCFLRRDGRRWASLCPRLNVASQGQTQEAAKSALTEALELWVESCVERETLHHALIDCGFRLIRPGTSVSDSEESFTVQKVSAAESAALGKAFPVEVKIPAYIAALLNERQHPSASC